MRKLKNNGASFLIFAICTIMVLTGCQNNKVNSKDIKESLNTKSANIKDNPSNKNEKFFFLNSIMTIKIFDEKVDKEKINYEIQERVKDLESKFSYNFPDSEVSKINKNAGIKPVKVSKDTYNVISTSIKYSEISNGKFDITVGNLVQLWAIGTDKEKLPSESQIKDAVKTINYKNIVLDEKNKTVFLKNKGMSIDLGAIAKGYVADQINIIFENYNVKSAISNLGGNIYVYGSKEGKDFKLGIRDPYNNDINSYMGIYKTQNESVVTSGVYERFFEKDGKKYHHILSTSTGYPVENELLATSIMTKNSMDADALSTTTFALGLKDGMKLIQSIPNTNAIFITKDKKIYITKNIKNKFEITEKSYKFEN